MANDRDSIRVAAVGDTHCTKTSRGALQPLLGQIGESADCLALCGDLTDHGLPEEAQVLVAELAAAGNKLPTVAVLGNHDYESGHAAEVKRILTGAGVMVLDGDAVEVAGVGFAGAKGFCGGFGRGTLSAFGEAGVKEFVQEAVDEAMKLEGALQRLRTAHKVAVLHYSPVRGTVEGEPVEIFPFLGCSRLEEPINRYPVNVVVHGHAHRGAPEGKTVSGIPVYNVALPVMRANYPDRPAFRMITFAKVEKGAGVTAGAPTQGPVESNVNANGVHAGA